MKWSKPFPVLPLHDKIHPNTAMVMTFMIAIICQLTTEKYVAQPHA